jgi:hypothetical protein
MDQMPAHAWSTEDKTALDFGDLGAVNSIVAKLGSGRLEVRFTAVSSDHNSDPKGWIDITEMNVDGTLLQTPDTEPLPWAEVIPRRRPALVLGNREVSPTKRPVLKAEAYHALRSGNLIFASIAEIKEMDGAGIKVFSVLTQVRGTSNPEPNMTFFPRPSHAPAPTEKRTTTKPQPGLLNKVQFWR